MFCPNCGANLPEGTTFCGSCGAPQKTQQQAPIQQPTYQAPLQQSAYQAPTQQPVYQPAPQQAQPMNRVPLTVSKKEFLANHADANTKKKAQLILITFILSMVLILASIIVPLTTPFFDIPAISLVMTMAEVDSDELIEEMEDTIDELRRDYKAQKAFMDDDEQEAAEAVMDSFEALSENFSVLNFKNLISVVQNEGADYMDSSDLDDFEQISQGMDIIIGLLIGAFVLPLLFALLGGLNKSTGLTVTALIFTVLSQFILCGFLYVLLSLVVFIFQAVLCSNLTKAYDNYRFGRTA